MNHDVKDPQGILLPKRMRTGIVVDKQSNHGADAFYFGSLPRNDRAEYDIPLLFTSPIRWPRHTEGDYTGNSVPGGRFL